MEDLKDKVAVITGGASGIGKAMAEKFAAEGMKLVLADVEQKALDGVVESFKANGVDVIGVCTDVSKEADVQNLSAETKKAFGTAHLVCNNAGVGAAGISWQLSQADWEWVLGVDLWGVIYGVRHFMPLLLDNGGQGHIVNTASMAGLVSGPGMAPYNVAKHGVVTLSECLYMEIQALGAPIGVSVLCPGWVNTRINESDRNRPGGAVSDDELDPLGKALKAHIAQALPAGLTAEFVAALVLDAVKDNQFYILPHQHWKGLIRHRMEGILHKKQPGVMEPPEDSGAMA